MAVAGISLLAAPYSGGIWKTTAIASAWTQIAGAPGSSMYLITYGAQKFVAIDRLDPSKIYTSLDGVTWTQQIQSSTWNKLSNNWTGFTDLIRAGDHFFVIGDQSVGISRDGIIWTAYFLGPQNRAVTFNCTGASNNLWVTVLSNGYIKYKYRYKTGGLTGSIPADGNDWIQSGTRVFGSSNNITSINGRGSVWVACGEEGNAYKSNDGINWMRSVAGAFTQGTKIIRYLNGYYFCINWNDNTVKITQDGITWTAITTAFPSTGDVIDAFWDGTSYCLLGRNIVGASTTVFITSSVTVNSGYTSRTVANFPGTPNYIRSAIPALPLPTPLPNLPGASSTQTEPIFTWEVQKPANILEDDYYELQLQWDKVITFDGPSFVEGGKQTYQTSTVIGGDSPPLTTNGTWYFRARYVPKWWTGDPTPWSATRSFTVTLYTIPAPTSQTTSGIDSYRPTIGATITGATPGTVPVKFLLKYEIATDVGFTAIVQSGIETGAGRTSGAMTMPIQANLDPAFSYYVRVSQVDVRDGRAGTTLGPSVLTITPANPPLTYLSIQSPLGTQGTSYPVMKVTLSAGESMVNVQRAMRPQIQYAKDAAFTVSTQIFPVGNLTLVPAAGAVFQSDTPNRIPQGHWYVRVRTIAEDGLFSAWSGLVSEFDIAHAPVATGTSPWANMVVVYQPTQVFLWTMGDSSLGDVQTAYRLLITRVDTGVVVQDTGKVVTPTWNASSTAITTGLKGIPLYWQVQLWDTDDVVGPLSTPIPFISADPPTITVTAPVTTTTSGNATISWTVGGTSSQVKYYLTVTDTVANKQVFTSTGTTSRSVKPATTVFKNATSYVLYIQVTTALGTITESTTTFTATYSAPATPVQLINGDDYVNDGYVSISWAGTTPDQTFYSWTVYRKDLYLDLDWVLLFTTTNKAITYYNDWTAITGHSYLYLVSQTADRFSTLIESVDPGTALPVTIDEASWWLIDPDNEIYNLRLNVKSDSFVDEYEETSYTVIGRGRRHEYGTRLGMTGTVDASIRPTEDLTASMRFTMLKNLKAQRKTLVLRDPFGNQYRVALGNISYSHVAGVGSTEMYDVSIPLEEVFW